MKTIACLAGAAGLLLSAPASATVRAVVVGVSLFTNPDLAPFDLPGAATDAARFGAALSRLGVEPEAVTTLTGNQATLGAIRHALDGLANGSQAGDRAIIFLSGHGTQAPAQAGDSAEPDGLDEIFLAADAAAWNASAHFIPGGLLDDEIDRRVGELRARGVDVWLVIDSCTSGGMLRGSRIAKTLAPDLLGIPAGTTLRGAVDASGFIDGRFATGGRLVAFAAAEPGAVAWDDGDGGAFTRALTKAMAQAQIASFGALAARAGSIWTAGDLSAPLLFAGRSPDLLGIAQGLPSLAVSLAVHVGQEGSACGGRGRGERAAPSDEAPLLLRHCDHVRVNLATAGAPLGIEAWYRDASGGYVSLAPPRGLIVAPGRWANVGFTFVTRDPTSGRLWPPGEEALVLIARDPDGVPIASKILRFRART